MAADEPVLKACKQCAEQIPAQARLCQHCHSFQDWRGYLAMSNSVLALLVALISVLSLALPKMVDLFGTRDSDLSLSNPVVRGDLLYLMATNSGTQPGIIERAEADGKALDRVATVEPLSAADAFVRPGSQQVAFKIALHLDLMDTNRQAAAVLPEIRPTAKDAAQIRFGIRQASGKRSTQTVPLTYSDLVSIFETHVVECEEIRDKASLANGCVSASATPVP